VTQRRRHSLLEAVVSTLIGFVLSFAIWPAVQAFILRQPVRMTQGFAVIAVYTIVSVVRQYVVRRAFNRAHRHSRAHVRPSTSQRTCRPGHACIVCEEPATRMIEGRYFCGWHGREGR
jgi:hypothetical protein